jgi:uncharacterized membrane protein
MLCIYYHLGKSVVGWPPIVHTLGPAWEVRKDMICVLLSEQEAKILRQALKDTMRDHENIIARVVEEKEDDDSSLKDSQLMVSRCSVILRKLR